MRLMVWFSRGSIIYGIVFVSFYLVIGSGVRGVDDSRQTVHSVYREQKVPTISPSSGGASVILVQLRVLRTNPVL